MKKAVVLLIIVASFLTGCSGTNGIDRIEFKNVESFNLRSAEVTGLSLSSLEVSDSVTLYKVKTKEFACDGPEVRALADFLQIDSDYLKINKEENDISSDIKCGASFHFSEGFKLSYYKSAYKGNMYKQLTYSDDELITMAKEVIEKIPYLEGQYEYTAMAENTVDEGTGEMVYGKNLTFRRRLDGHLIYGGGYCIVGFSEYGLSLLRVSYYDYEECGEYDIISAGEANEKIRKPQIFTTKYGVAGGSNVKQLDVEKCDLVYDNECLNGYDTIQPFYRVTGTVYDRDGKNDRFTMYIPALKG